MELNRIEKEVSYERVKARMKRVPGENLGIKRNGEDIEEDEAISIREGREVIMEENIGLRREPGKKEGKSDKTGKGKEDKGRTLSRRGAEGKDSTEHQFPKKCGNERVTPRMERGDTTSHKDKTETEDKIPLHSTRNYSGGVEVEENNDNKKQILWEMKKLR